jgi:hypothetical protein
MRSLVFAGMALTLSAAAIGQPSLEAPVTRAEVRQAMERVEAVMAKRLSVAIPKSTLTGEAAATRAEILAEFTRVLKAIEPKFRFTPRPQRVYESHLKAANEGVALEQARRLVQLGMIGPVGPLAVGTGGLTPKQFGDSLGLFFAQAASFTHTPRARWTPNLMNPQGF